MSIVRKMIIVKTIALSQLIFACQSMEIKESDLKRIEATCYNFVWSRNRDRIKRAMLKNEKQEGGINGVDLVDCFIRIIRLRQFFKAEKGSDYRSVTFLLIITTIN